MRSREDMDLVLNRACERVARRSFGEAAAICAQLAPTFPNVWPAHFHLLATLPEFLADRADRDEIMAASRLAHIQALVAQAESEHLVYSRGYMMLMVASQQLYAADLASERNRDPKRLMRYGAKVFSQSDEDGLIQEVFRRIGTADQTFLEIGVQSGIECNTAKLLLEGWRGGWIECSANFVAMERVLFADRIAAGQLVITQRFVTVEEVDAIVAQSGLAGEIDLLSLDIDGNDIWVWQALERVRPRAVIIEYNATYAPPLCNAVPYQRDRVYGGTSYFGASLGALVKVGRRKGYNLVGCSYRGNNAIFVRADLCGDYFHAPFTAEEHFEPVRYPVMAPWGYLPDAGSYVSL
jgi:hypothetical protein